MTSQDDRRTMEAMLASIREAIHRETALQMAGLHRAGDRVVVDHEPVSRPVEPAAMDGVETSPPDYLRPLRDAAEEDVIPSSAETGKETSAAERSAKGSAGAEDEDGGDHAHAEPLRLAAGAETGIEPLGSIEDLFEPEKADRLGGVQARQHESLFEDILAGRRSVGRIEPDRSAGTGVDRSGHGGAWHEPARRVAEAAPDAPSPATDVAEERAKEGTDVRDLQDLREEVTPPEDGPAAADGDPLNEIDLDDDIIWTAPEAEPPAHEGHQAAAAASSSADVTDATDDDGQSAAENMEEAALVAPDVAERVAEAFGRLDAEMMLSALGGSAALERIVRQEMRPLLREWLNAHLPELVERIIREEIQRIIHGGRTPRSL